MVLMKFASTPLGVCLTGALLVLCRGVTMVTGTEDYGTVIGIDLGTTFSCVGIYQHDRVEIIANSQGNRITPSYVAFTADGERLTGEGAANQLATNPKNTAFQAKRLIGHKWNDDNVQRDIDFFPFTVVKKRSMPYIRLNTGQKNMRDFAPEEISAMVLTHMKQTAEDYLGKKVTHAVITVPAYFNDAQRLATKDAGTIAGLSVLRILNEPTAAAMAYGVDKRLHETTILVFDLGGGTFDVTVLSIDDGVFRVLATNGDTHLGGEDFDRRIVEHFMEVIKKKHGKNIEGDHKAIQKLRKAAEAAKRGLSSQLQETLLIDSLLPGFDFKETLTRAKFEALNKELFKSTMEPVQQVLEDAQVDKSQLNEIVLVGGSTRIPKIQQLVKDFFDGKEPSRGINPDEAVAYGAAVQAAIFGGTMDSRKKPTLIDVNALTLGIEIIGGIMSSIIPRNTELPTKKSHIYTTVVDDQTTIMVNVFEGERQMVNNNHKIGSFDLTGITPARRGVPKVEITFEIDFDGILVVTAEDRGSQNKGHIVINTDQKRFSSSEIELMVQVAQTYAAKDEMQRERIDSRNDLEQYIYKVQSQLDGKTFSSKLSAQDESTLVEALEVLSAWIVENPNASVSENKEQKEKLRDIVHPIVSKIYHDPSEF